LQDKFNTKSDLHTKEISELETEKETLEGEVNILKEENNEIKEKNTELSEQLRKKELSRFASAYATQENEYKTQQDLWFKLSLWATALLTVSVLIPIFGHYFFIDSKQWYKEPGFYLLDAIFLTLFVYTLKQHAHLGNLKIDYANRKTLAQSYQHIIEDGEEDPEVRKRFLERASDIFSSKAVLKDNDVTVPEALLSKITGKKNN